MKYTAEFTSLKGRDYKIELETATQGTDRILKLSGTPFVSDVAEGEGGLYAPIRCGGATVGLLTDEPVYDLYSGQALGVKVTVTRGAEKVWLGYVSPTMYDQGYDGELEELQLDCVDGIAVLKNIPYRTEERRQKTLLELIRACLDVSGVFDTLYISDNVQMATGGTESVCERLRVSENNFFDDKDDSSQADDDVAWSCYDVLEEIMRYLGLTMVSEGSAVYCVDYDAIKRSTPYFHRYSLRGSDASDGARVAVQWSHRITGESYGASGTKISLDKIYNKVSVADDFRSMETMFPTFGDEAFEENITLGAHDQILEMWSNDNSGAPVYRWPVTVRQTVDGKSDNFQAFYCAVSKKDNPSQSKDYLHYVAIVKFYRSDVLRFRRYRGEEAVKDDYTSGFENNATWGNMLNSYGAAYVKMYLKSLTPEDTDKLREKISEAGASNDPDKRWDAYREFLNISAESVKFEPMIIFNNPSDGHIGPTAIRRRGNYGVVTGQGTDLEDCQSYPCIELRDTLPENVFGGENAYLVMKGDYLQHGFGYLPLPLETTDNDDLDKAGDYKLGDETYLWAKLKWGDRWLSPEGAWEDSERFFKVWWRKLDDDVRVSTYFAKSYQLHDTTAANFVTGEKGVFISAPPSGNLSGKPELTVFMSRDSRGRSKRGAWDGDKDEQGRQGNLYTRYYNEAQILRNFAIEFRTNAGGALNESDLLTDTVYTNDIENGSVDEMDEITFRVCTFDGKDQSYSTVDYLEKGVSQYADRLYNKALLSLEGMPMRQEEHMVFKCVTQYEAPRLLFEVNLDGTLNPVLFGSFSGVSFPGKVFVPVSKETDWRMETVTLKLLEKA